MTRLLSARDLFRLRWLDDPQISPDGTRCACTCAALDEALDGMVSQVWVCDQAGGDLRQIGAREARSHSPRWSPQGDRLAFVSDAVGTEQIWLCELGSGDQKQLTRATGGASEPAWSPDGRWVVFSAPDGECRQIWRVSTAGGDAQPVTRGDWQASAPQFSPDGSRIAFLALPAGGAASDLWVCGAEGGNHRQLTPGSGPVRALAWSPDSRSLAFIGHAQGSAQGVNSGVWAVAADGGTPTCLTAGFDRCAGLTVRADDVRGTGMPPLCWLADGIYFIYAEGGRSHIARVTPDGAVQTAVGGERACLSFSVAAGADTLAFIASDALNPGELHTARRDGGGERTLTRANEWLADCALSRPERLSTTASDGQAVEAWLMRPPALAATERPPLILQIHGGPHYSLGERFYFEFQRLAAQGYAVLYVNMRGSQGYGEAFATGIRGDWGGHDYRDLMECLDAALARGDLDAERLAVTGVSYGGYMTNWIIGHTTRFRAAICENGISNLRTNFATSPHGGAFWEWELDGTPDSAPERYRALSPVTYAERVRTPLLLVHAEQDANCAIAQSEEMAAALQALGREVSLARIPGEGHLMNLVGTPRHRLRRAAAVDDWLARWL